MIRLKLLSYILIFFLLFFTFPFQSDSLVSATTEPLKTGISQTLSGEGSIPISILECGSDQIHSGSDEEKDADGLKSGTSNEVSGSSMVTTEQMKSPVNQLAHYLPIIYNKHILIANWFLNN